MDSIESPKDKMARLELMAEGEPTWDLSDNDRAAIQYALDRIKALERELADKEAARLQWAETAARYRQQVSKST